MTEALDIARQIIAEARAQGARTLSEYDSKRVLAAHGVPVTAERLADDADGAAHAAQEIGYPVIIAGGGRPVAVDALVVLASG